MTPPRPHFLGNTPPVPQVLAAGPWHDGEFATLRQTLDPDACWQVLPTLKAAVTEIAASSVPPELVLLAQPRPGYGAEQELVEELRRVAPLTRVIVVAGSWCEGELRTGRPLAGVVRLYWYEFAAWWRTALDRLALGAAPPWSEPLDDVRAGQTVRRFRVSSGLPKSAPLADHTIAIDATDFAVFEALADLLSPFGGRCVWQPRHRPELADAELTLGICDGGQLEPAELDHLRRFASRLAQHDAAVLVLLDFPRHEHYAMAQEIGAAAILAKPFQADVLITELTRLVHHADASLFETAIR